MKEQIQAYKISYDGAHYYDLDFPLEAEIGTIVEFVLIDKEYYESLPEFQGF